MRPGRLLVVLAHPDDESLACGGTIARSADEGFEVTLVTATSGQAGPGAGSAAPSEVTQRRERELRAAASILGITRLDLLGLRDGMLSWLPRPPIVSRLTEIIVDVWPDAIVTFGAEGLYWHPDHIAIGAITEEAVARAAFVGPAVYRVTLPRGAMAALVNAVRLRDGSTSPTLWGIGADRFGLGAPIPSLVVNVSAVLDRKLAALRCHVSQLAPDSALVRATDDEAAAWLGVEHFRLSNASPARISVLDRLGESAGALRPRTAPVHRRTQP